MLRDGGRVETAGPWTVKGRLVTFKVADGTLSSLRLAEVDLAASAEATAAAIREEEKAAAPAATVKRPPALVLTDADIPKAAKADGDEDSAAGAEAGQGEEAKAALESTGEQTVAVVSWEQQIDEQGALVTGVVRNGSESVATAVAITVRILDDAGGELGKASAAVDTTFLAPGETSAFRAFFSEVASLADAKFEVTSTRYVGKGEMSAPAAPPPAGT